VTEKHQGEVTQEGDAFYIGDKPIEDDKTPMLEENEAIQNKSAIVQYQKNFQELFLEIHDLDKGYALAKEGFTNALLSGGSNSNPQEVYQYIDMLTTRMEKIHIIRRICAMVGLQGDLDKIIDYELELLYRSRQAPVRKTTTELSNPIAGETKYEPKNT